MNDDNIWIKTVNIRVESMPLSPASSELSTGTGMEDLGKCIAMSTKLMNLTCFKKLAK